MTWWRQGDRYEVFFNRDELKTRSRAVPPELMLSDNSIRFISPTDPNAGGTWMLVNELGVTICLLNRWHESLKVPTASKSRGQLVLGLAGSADTAEVITRLSQTDCREYKPFTLVALDQQRLLVEAWDGGRLYTEQTKAPLTSSSYCFPEVSKARRDRYATLDENGPQALSNYHAGEVEQSAFTVRMNRPDAQTWSRSHLVVGPAQIAWQYLEELPNLDGESVEHNIELDRRK